MLDSVEKIKVVQSNDIVLLQSGGLDSCVLACLYKKMGFNVHHLFIDYGQNCKEKELESVKKIVKEYGGVIHTAKIEIPWFKDYTNLVEDQQSIFDDNIPENLGSIEAKTYVPLRNHIFLSLAGSLAESLNIPLISCAINGGEDEFKKPIGYTPDAHANFVLKIEESLSEASTFKHLQNKEFVLLTPLLFVDKSDIIRYAYYELNMDFSLSWSCYNNTSNKPCGVCPSCCHRAESFKIVGIKDTSLN